MVDKKKFLTKEWYEKLVQELHELKTTKLPAILERLAEAKAMWDLSENFEYKSALEDRDFANSKIAEIEDLLQDVEIVDEKAKKGNTVDFGSTVTFEIEDDKQYTATIVGSGEVDVEDGLKISLDSPVWIAIKGKKVWDTGKMRIGNNRKNVKVISIK